MATDATTSLRRGAAVAVAVAGSLAAAAGGTVFILWLADVMPHVPAYARPKTNMALAQFLAGAALLLIAFPGRRWRKWAGVSASVIVLSLGVLTLSEHAVGWDLHIDEIFAQEPPGADGTISSNRMGPPGSTSLALIGTGLISLALLRRGPAPYLGLAVCLINIVPAIGFLYGITAFYNQPEWTGISWQSVVVLLALGGGLILASREVGPMVLLMRDDAGGRMIRRMLPVALVLPLSLGLVRTYGERIGLYDTITGRGLLVISLTLVLTGFLWRTAARLSKVDKEQRDAVEALRVSEERYRLAILATNDAIWDIDIVTGVVQWNDTYAKLFGRPDGAGDSAQWWIDHIHPDDRTRVTTGLHNAINGAETFWSGEYRFKRASGEWADVLDRAYIARDASGKAVRVIGAMLDMTDRKAALRQLELLNQTLEQRVAERTNEARQRTIRLRSLAGDLTRTEERERRRLAQLLHDGLQQILVATNLQLTIARGATSPGEVKEAIDAVRELIDQSIRESRSLTIELSPPVLYDAGLEPALQWLSRWMHDMHKLSVTVSRRDGTEPQSEDTAVFLFQSVREALFNVVKHAGADRAEVTLGRAADGRIEIVVADEGRGFDPAEQAHAGENDSFGLFAIRERLALIGGDMAIDSKPGGGTRVTLLAPAALESADTAAPGATAKRDATTGAIRAIRVVLADDHDIFRRGLAGLLGAEPGIEVVGQASDGQAALELARQLRPDVIVMDVTMPRMNGIEATRRVRAERLCEHVIGLSMHGDDGVGASMREAGAAEFLNKAGPSAALIASIRRGREAKTQARSEDPDKRGVTVS